MGGGTEESIGKMCLVIFPYDIFSPPCNTLLEVAQILHSNSLSTSTKRE